MLASRVVGVLVVIAGLGAGACRTYPDQLARGQRAFEHDEHDRALAILRDLEPDRRRLSLPEQATYAYLRGMTDYRIGYRADARHWLAVAKAFEDGSPGVLAGDWKARTQQALDELNGVVYAHGTGALTTERRSDGATEASGTADAPKSDAPKSDAPKSDTDASTTDAPKSDTSKSDASTTDAPKSDTSKSDTSKSDASKSDASKSDAVPKKAPATKK